MSAPKIRSLTPSEQRFVRVYSKVHGPATVNAPRRGAYIKLEWTPLSTRVLRQYDQRTAIVYSTLDDGYTYAGIAEGELELARGDFTILDPADVADDVKTQLTLVDEQSFRTFFTKGLEVQQLGAHVPPDPTQLRCGSIVVHRTEFADSSLGVVACVLNDTTHAVVVWVDDVIWYRREKLERLARASSNEVARQPRLRRDRLVRTYAYVTDAYIYMNCVHQTTDYEHAVDHLRFAPMPLCSSLGANITCIDIDDRAAERCVENMLLNGTNAQPTHHTERTAINVNDE